MARLIKTTISELALLADELEMNDSVVFSTEDPSELEYYNLQPCKYNLIHKTNMLYEKNYVIAIGLMDGHCTVAKDIYILSNGNVDDEDERIDGIENFIQDYYDKYMVKNKDDAVYLVYN